MSGAAACTSSSSPHGGRRGRAERRPEAGCGLQASPRAPRAAGMERGEPTPELAGRGAPRRLRLPSKSPPNCGESAAAPPLGAGGREVEGGGLEPEAGSALVGTAGERAPGVSWQNLTRGRRIPSVTWRQVGVKVGSEALGYAESPGLIQKETTVEPCDLLTWLAWLADFEKWGVNFSTLSKLLRPFFLQAAFSKLAPQGCGMPFK